MLDFKPTKGLLSTTTCAASNGVWCNEQIEEVQSGIPLSAGSVAAVSNTILSGNRRLYSLMPLLLFLDRTGSP